MASVNENQTQNIRIPKKIHEQIKSKCNQEGLLIGPYVARILNVALSMEKGEDLANQEQNPQNK